MKEHIRRKGPIRQSAGDRAFNIVNAVVMTLITVVIVYPLYYVLLASITDPVIVNSGKLLFYPESPYFEGYARAFDYAPLWTGYGNTLKYTVVGTAVALLCTIPAGYALSRMDLPGRRVIMFLFTFTMFFSGGMVPTYLLISRLHLLDTIWAILLPSAVGMYNIIIMRTYFQTTIPQELEDAAEVDGCTNFRFLLSVALPLSRPVIVVIALYYGVGRWNDYFAAMMYLTKRTMYPLQLVLREILLQNQAGDMLHVATGAGYADRMIARMGLKYAVIVISTLPILLIFPFVQRFFAKGVMIGGATIP